MKSTVHKRLFKFAAVVITAMVIFVNLTWIDRASAAFAGPHHSFLGGPWEIIVQTRLDGQASRFPLNVSDENKPQKLDAVLPIKDIHIEIRLEEYVPDLKWETDAVEHPGGEIAAKLLISGKNLKQEIWLSASNPARQSITSSIGGVSIKRIHDTNNIEMLMQGLTDSRAVGVLSIWPEDGNGNPFREKIAKWEPNQPFECIAKTSETISIPGSEYKLKIVEYLPHYSIDTKTKKVVSQSQKPVNPAVKVLLDDGKKRVERWLWAKFPSSPHQETELPLRIRFTDFDLSGSKGQYILAVASGTNPWLLLSKKGKKTVEKAVLGRPYPFEDRQYSFSIEKIIDGAIIKTDWANGSQKLLHPAVIATIKQSDTDRQAVLELNKPVHFKMKSGTLVLLYRRTQASLM
jgi:hypothetical protein